MKFVSVLTILFLSINVFAQTKTEKETIPISTQHSSISVQAKKNGSALEVWVYNNSITTYNVSFTANVTLRGDKGEFTKNLKYSGKIAPSKSDYTMPVYIGYANAITSDVYCSLIEGEVNGFNAIPIEKEGVSESSNNSSYSGSSNTTSESEVRYNTNPKVNEVIERQNRLNELQKKQLENERIAKEFTERNQQNYIEQQKQQQKTTQDVLELGGAIRELYAEKAAREEAEDARKQAYALRMEEETRSRKLALETKINNRKATIAEFPAKDIPLGSQEKALSIYYFIFAYDNSINNEYGATVYVSNVFEIGKYNDGTMPYTTSVKNEIINLTPFSETLHGYYYSQQEAEKLRQMFIVILKNNGVTINEVGYKGRPAVIKNTAAEKTSSNVEQSKYGKNIHLDGENNEQNPAPALLNPPKNGDFKIRDEKETNPTPNSKYGKTINID